MKRYAELKDKQPEMWECFFAFSNSQFAEGKKKAGIEDRKLYDGGMGLYGTQEGIKKFFNFYDNLDKEIAENCDPQEAYNYEFDNHECSITCDDSDVIAIVIHIFGKDKAKTVKRKYGYTEIS